MLGLVEILLDPVVQAVDVLECIVAQLERLTHELAVFELRLLVSYSRLVLNNLCE